jgi:hypothetical protein
MAMDKAPLNSAAPRVVPFRRPGIAASARPAAQRSPAPDTVKGLEGYEEDGDGAEDYRHRMLANVAAAAFCLLLGAGGIWVAISIADLRKNQDCALAGRRNCAQLSIPYGPGVVGDERAAVKAAR